MRKYLLSLLLVLGFFTSSLASNLDLGNTSLSTGLIYDVASSARITGNATSILTGSIDPTASTAVVGVGTKFTTELVVGDRITVSGETRTVTAITDDTNLTVLSAFSDNANDTSPDKLAAILVVRDAAGNVVSVVNDLGQLLISNGTAAAPSIGWLSDNDGTGTGFFRIGANNFRITLDGVQKWDFVGNNFGGLTNGSAQISLGPASATNPTLQPNGFNSATGIGSPGTNLLSLIANEIEGSRISATGIGPGSTLGITSGSGTGLTVNEYGLFKRNIHKVTVDYTGLSAVALTADKVIATLPAKTKLVGIIADTTTKYIGGAVTAATLIVGKTVGGNQYILSHDVFTAAIMKGGNNIDADFGAALSTGNNVIKGEDLPSWTATTDISVRLTTVTANTNALTQGSTTYYLITEAMP